MKSRGIASWCFVNHIDSKYDEWKVTLTLTKKEADKLKAVGLKVNKVVTDDDEILLQYQFKRNGVNKKTKAPNKKPSCVDAALQPYDGMVGNGSEVIVKHRPFAWDNKFGKGISSDFQALQVLNLVEFEGASDDDDDGFEVMGDGLSGDDKDDEFKVEKPGSPDTDDDEDDEEY